MDIIRHGMKNVIQKTYDIIFDVIPKTYDVIFDVIPKTFDVIPKTFDIIPKTLFDIFNISTLNMYILENLISKVLLIESMLLVDGLICSIVFIKDYIILKINFKNMNNQQITTYNKNIIEKCNKIYELSSIDRIIFYVFINSVYLIVRNIIDTKILYVILSLLSYPDIQNFIFNIKFIKTLLDRYIKNKYIFIKYFISKTTIQFIQTIHPQIEKIKNYHIFIVYTKLSYNFVWNICKNLIFIFILNTLRSFTYTYWIYKTIKIGYYQHCGYLYNIIPLDNAIYYINIIIKEKRWNECEKIEVINAFYTLIVNKYNINTNTSLFDSVRINFYKICSIWSILLCIKMIYILQIISNIWLYLLLVNVYCYLTKYKIKHIIISSFVYFFIIFDINTLYILCIILSNQVIYYLIIEIYFFILNLRNIKKILTKYK